jgi:hypothetical protein
MAEHRFSNSYCNLSIKREFVIQRFLGGVLEASWFWPRENQAIALFRLLPKEGRALFAHP